MKKRILFIAPNSYPPVNPEANVNAKVIKLLSEAGYCIDLICRTPRRQLYIHDGNTDFFFGKLNSIHIISVNPGINISTLVRHAKTFLKFGYVYRGADWAYEAAHLCDTLIRQNKYDFVYTYDYPSELVGLYIAKKYGIRWVATWNDPYIWEKYPYPYGKGFHYYAGVNRERLIRQIGRYTYRNAFPSLRLRDYMRKYMTGMQASNCVILPHLVLDELMSKNEKLPDKTLKLIHSGALGKERNPESLFKGLRMFIDKYPEADIEVSLLGVFERIKGNFVSDLIDKYSLEKYIRLLAPVSYVESLEIVKHHHVCLVVEADLEEGIFLPSKIADYLQNSKQIFAVSPRNGLLHDEYQAGIIDYFSDVKSAKSVANTFEQIYHDFKGHKLGNPDKDDSKYHNKSILSTHSELILK